MHFRPAAAWLPGYVVTAACVLGVLLAAGPTGPTRAQSRPGA